MGVIASFISFALRWKRRNSKKETRDVTVIFAKDGTTSHSTAARHLNHKEKLSSYNEREGWCIHFYSVILVLTRFESYSKLIRCIFRVSFRMPITIFIYYKYCCCIKKELNGIIRWSTSINVPISSIPHQSLNDEKS